MTPSPPNDKAIELLPCPFCGGEAEHGLDHTVEENHYIMCTRCCFDIGRFQHGDEYINVWNARANLQGEWIKRLEGALTSIAKNTCCGGCQEAAKVARAVLDEGGK